MEQLLTKQDLAKHWQVSVQTIDNYIKDGLITPCKKIPCNTRFNSQYIAELDGVKLEKHSPLEWRRVEKELEYWKNRTKELEKSIARMNMITTEIMYSKQKGEMEGQVI